MRTDRLWLVGVVLTLAVGCGSKAPPDEPAAARESLAARVKAQTQNPDGGAVAEMLTQSDPSHAVGSVGSQLQQTWRRPASLAALALTNCMKFAWGARRLCRRRTSAGRFGNPPRVSISTNKLAGAGR
jgi:hypothetical protein